MLGDRPSCRFALGRRRRAVFDPIEKLRDDSELLENYPPPGLAGVGREHGDNKSASEMVSDLVRRDLTAGDQLQG